MVLLYNSIIQKTPSHDPRMFHMIQCSITMMIITNCHLNLQFKIILCKILINERFARIIHKIIRVYVIFYALTLVQVDVFFFGCDTITQKGTNNSDPPPPNAPSILTPHLKIKFQHLFYHTAQNKVILEDWFVSTYYSLT